MADLSEFERSNRLDVARAVRDGRLSRREGADFLLERAMRRLEVKEEKAKRGTQEGSTDEAKAGPDG